MKSILVGPFLMLCLAVLASATPAPDAGGIDKIPMPRPKPKPQPEPKLPKPAPQTENPKPPKQPSDDKASDRDVPTRGGPGRTIQ